MMSTTQTVTEAPSAQANSLTLRSQSSEHDDDTVSQESYSTVAGTVPAPGPSPDSQDKKKEENDSDEEEPSPCGRCRKMVVRGDEALMCEICSRWFHIKCEKISKTQYKNQASKSKNFHWYCDGCDIVHSGIIREVTLLKVDQNKFKKRLEELEETKVSKDDLQREMEKKADKEEVEKLEQRITTMEGKQGTSGESSAVNEGASCSKTPEEQAEEVIKEIKDQEERMLNALLFNVPEDKASNEADRIKHDKEEVKHLAKHCKVNISKDEITKVVRLGKKQDNKPRPLLIQISTPEKKRMLFKNLRLLQEAPQASVC